MDTCAVGGGDTMDMWWLGVYDRIYDGVPFSLFASTPTHIHTSSGDQPPPPSTHTHTHVHMQTRKEHHKSLSDKEFIGVPIFHAEGLTVQGKQGPMTPLFFSRKDLDAAVGLI